MVVDDDLILIEAEGGGDLTAVFLKIALGDLERDPRGRAVGGHNQSKQRFTRGYKRYKETSGLIEWKECQIFHSIFT